MRRIAITAIGAEIIGFQEELQILYLEIRGRSMLEMGFNVGSKPGIEAYAGVIVVNLLSLPRGGVLRAP